MATTVAIGALGIGATLATLGIAAVVPGGITLGVGGAALSLTSNDSDHKTLAAGDTGSSDYVIWTKGGLSTRKHKSSISNTSHAYSVKSSMISVGFTNLMDTGNLIGGFYQLSREKVRVGDQESTNMHHDIGLNGNLYLTDKLHLMGVGLFGISNGSSDNFLDNGKDSNIWKVTGKVAYDFKLSDNVLLMPKVGLEYINMHRKPYTTKTGTDFKSLSFSTLDSIARLTLQAAFLPSDFYLVGQVFADIHYTLSADSEKMRLIVPAISQEEASLPMSSSVKDHYNLGTKITLAYLHSFKTNIAYTYSFDKNETAHTGVLGFYLMF
jgi:hypothetical protein